MGTPNLPKIHTLQFIRDRKQPAKRNYLLCWAWCLCWSWCLTVWHPDRYSKYTWCGSTHFYQKVEICSLNTPKYRGCRGAGGVGPQAIVEDLMNKGRAKVQTWGSVQKGFTIRKTKQDTNNFGGSQVANCASMDLMTQHKNSTVSSEQ